MPIFRNPWDRPERRGADPASPHPPLARTRRVAAVAPRRAAWTLTGYRLGRIECDWTGLDLSGLQPGTRNSANLAGRAAGPAPCCAPTHVLHAAALALRGHSVHSLSTPLTANAPDATACTGALRHTPAPAASS